MEQSRIYVTAIGNISTRVKIRNSLVCFYVADHSVFFFFFVYFFFHCSEFDVYIFIVWSEQQEEVDEDDDDEYSLVSPRLSPVTYAQRSKYLVLPWLSPVTYALRSK
jgi:hypothetical protein